MLSATRAKELRERLSTLKKYSGNAGLAEYAGVALQSLRENKLRSFLTLLGIIIGISSIIAVISLIQGFDKYWKEKIANFGPNAFAITQYPIATNLDKIADMIRRNKDVHLEDAEAIGRQCNACELVGVETHRNVLVKYRHQSLEDIDLGGITPNIFEIEGKRIEQGRGFMEWEDEHSRFVTIVGWEVAEKLFGNGNPVGSEVQIGDHWYTVVGVGEKRGTVFGFSQDNYVKIPISTFHKIYGARRSVNISIRARAGELADAQEQARQIMRARHRLHYGEDDDFGLITSEGVNDLFNSLTGIIFSVSLFVVGVSLVVGGIVIMNIMLVSVVERTKEIGIRKAVGARQQDVVNQFLVESVVLCCAGGAGGVLSAWCFSWLLVQLTPLPSAFPYWAPLLAFALCTIIGVTFGIYPARRAGRLDPIEALRSE